MPHLSLTDAEREAVRLAVADAEKKTSGEIVPYVVGRSGLYEVAVWRGAAFGALALSALVIGLASWYSGWGYGWIYSAWAMALAMTGGGVAGAVLARYVAWLRRLLAGPDDIDKTVHRRAVEAFVAEEVFNTRDRTGILIFVSLFEHRIEVLGDVGINQKVKPDEWISVVEMIQRGIKGGALATGLIDAIQACGDLLDRRGVALREDDTDELPDNLRVRDS